MTAIVARGNAADLHLPDETVDLIVTSPPYFSLRSYQDNGEHYAGQIGCEATSAEYLGALIDCTREWMRVLKPGGSIFVNLGDKYAGQGGGPQGASSSRRGRSNVSEQHKGGRVGGAPAKSLIGLPWRYAIRCIDDLGLILRAEIVWAKPNGLPESVTDRVRRSHEQVFHFVKQPRYFSAVDEVREPHVYPNDDRSKRPSGYAPGMTGHMNGGPNPLGKLPGSVWSIPTSPLRVPAELGIDHFAAYPPELVRRIVLGWSPREVCTACGEGRQPVIDRRTTGRDNNDQTGRLRSTVGLRGDDYRQWRAENPRTITGYSCACPDTIAAATPGVVLDPFGGTGTTALVASVHGRVGISVDLSADYCRLAQWRTTDEKQRARAAGIKLKGRPRMSTPAPLTPPLAQTVAAQLDLDDIDDLDDEGAA